MRNMNKKIYQLLLLVIMICNCLWAAVQPADVFSDHMVLQRDKSVPIWGTAKAGEQITVGFSGQTKTAIADGSGQWIVRLKPMAASTEPKKLTVKGSKQTIVYDDILVGDVWIAGGQSNMGRDVNRSWRPQNQRMDYPKIRFLKVVSRGSKYPNTRLTMPGEPPRKPAVSKPNKWNVCTENNTPECCAVGFFFAERIFKQTGVPQGLLWNAWAGSTAKEWIPQFGWSLRPQLQKTAQAVDSWYPGTQTGRAAYFEVLDQIDTWHKKAQEAVINGYPFPFPQPMLPEPDDARGKGRGTTILYNGRVHPLVPYAIKGILWYQGESDYANRGYLPQIEAMVQSWRKLFAASGEKPTDLPFYFVQMQRCGTYMSPNIRDQQFQSYFTIPNAGMAVLLDLDVQLHPGNKYDAGRRLALWALAKDYRQDVIYTGPIYRRHRTDGNKVIIEFDHTHGGLMIGKKNKLEPVETLDDGKLLNLEITSDGRNWVPAKSKINGETLIVWAGDIKNPTDVRYCWKSKADEPFIYNKAKLPSPQFNTATDYSPTPKQAVQNKSPKRKSPRQESQARQTIKLSPVFTDNCVLQRDAKVPVWGRTAPGEKVTVTFADQTARTTADRFGKWKLMLNPMPPSSKGRSLIAKDTLNTLEIKSVYVGDVFLYLSQSWHLSGPDELRVDSDTIPPICINASGDVWENKSHSRRRQDNPDSAGRWSIYKTPGRYFRNDGYYLGLGITRKTSVPIGILGLGASTLESMTPPQGYDIFAKELGESGATVATWLPHTRQGKTAYLEKLKEIETWSSQTRARLAQLNISFRDFTQPPQLPGPPYYKRAETTHYNFVTHRFSNAAIKGIIIQPKVFNLGDPDYLLKAKALIYGLRKAFGRKDLPVCFMQMHTPGRYELKEAQNPNDWLNLRHLQNQIAQIPHTDLVATYDLKNIERSQQDMGLRAAQWAVSLINSDKIKTGPVYKNHRIEGGQIIVNFDNVGKGLMFARSQNAAITAIADSGRGRGFKVAGPDGKWHDALATFKGNTIIVSSDKVPNPAHISYAWSVDSTNANLFNQAGFPALPFKSNHLNN